MLDERATDQGNTRERWKAQAPSSFCGSAADRPLLPALFDQNSLGFRLDRSSVRPGRVTVRPAFAEWRKPGNAQDACSEIQTRAVPGQIDPPRDSRTDASGPWPNNAHRGEWNGRLREPKRFNLIGDRSKPPSLHGDFPIAYCPDRVGGNSHDGDGFARQRGKFDFITSSASMDHHDAAHITGLQSFLGKVLGQDDGVEFLDHR